MINLLPYEEKRQIRAARHNVILFKCLVLLVLAIVFLIINYFYTVSVINANPIEKPDPNKDDIAIIEQASVIQSTLGTISIFNDSNLTSYLLNIFNYLPGGVILESISINQQNVVEKSLEIIAYGKTKDSLAMIKTELPKSQLVSSVEIGEIKDSDKQNYPYLSNVSIILEANKQ